MPMIPFIEVLELRKTPPALLDSLSHLIFPTVKTNPHPINLYDPNNYSLYPIAAFVDHRPVGLLLMKLSPKMKAAEICSLQVVEQYRGQTIGTQLIKFAVEQLKSVGLKFILITYPDRRPETSVIENFLKKNNFKGKALVLAEFMFDYSGFKPDWYLRKYQWPSLFEIFPWGELSYFEAMKIRHRYAQQALPSSVYPFQSDGFFEPLNSLGLRYKGELIGWVITERLSSDTINYGNLFIDYDFQKKGYAIHLLIDSLNIHYNNQIKWGIFKINILQASAQWLKFIRCRLAPHADFIYEYYQSFIEFNF
jgi:GNAT superfamily N-acetyltransferase